MRHVRRSRLKEKIPGLSNAGLQNIVLEIRTLKLAVIRRRESASWSLARLAALLLCLVAAFPVNPQAQDMLPATPLTMDQVVEQMVRSNEQRTQHLQSYTATRSYHLKHQGRTETSIANGVRRRPIPSIGRFSGQGKRWDCGPTSYKGTSGQWPRVRFYGGALNRQAIGRAHSNCKAISG